MFFQAASLLNFKAKIDRMKFYTNQTKIKHDIRVLNAKVFFYLNCLREAYKVNTLDQL